MPRESALSPAEIAALLASLPAWRFESGALRRTYKTDGWRGSMLVASDRLHLRGGRSSCHVTVLARGACDPLHPQCERDHAEGFRGGGIDRESDSVDSPGDLLCQTGQALRPG
jgi:hypothetical protein